MQTEGAPHRIAGGTAVGIFWGFSPLLGAQMILAAITATVFNVSRLPAILAVHITNPVTAFIIYPTTWAVGDLLLRPFCSAADRISWGEMDFSLSCFLNLAGQTMMRMLVGGFVVGTICGLIAYYRIFRAIVRYRRAMAAVDAAAARPQPAPAETAAATRENDTSPE